ncbi:23S rRNA (guanosine(2251)-2'-O)-methyltransferase RlmB [Deltaproteobacteria bacterium TL4]
MNTRKRIHHNTSSKASSQDYLYGLIPVQQALIHQRRTLYKLFLKQETMPSKRSQELKQLASEINVPVAFLTKDEIDNHCPDVTHQGVLLQCGPLPLSDPSLLQKPQAQNFPLFLALDQVEDPHNLGAIIRSCGFFKASGVVVGRDHFCGITSTVSKTSAGVVENFPVVVVPNLSRYLEEQKKNNYWIVGLDGEGDQDLKNMRREQPLILVLGNEGKGLRPLVRSTCDWLIRIAGSPEVGSLNVSNAAAIALYQLSL